MVLLILQVVLFSESQYQVLALGWYYELLQLNNEHTKNHLPSECILFLLPKFL